MRITEGQLRRIIREELLGERREVSVSDVYKHKEKISQWVEKLLLDIGNTRAKKVGEMDEKRRQQVVDRLTHDVSMALLDALGAGSPDRTPLSSAPAKYGSAG